MISTGEALRLLLAALGVGVMVPVMVQLFLTLRQIQRTIRQVDPSLRLLNQIAERQTEAPPASSQPAAPQLASIIAALVPTVIAAYQAFRQHSSSSSSSDTCPSAGQDSAWDISVSTRESREPEAS